MADFLSNVLLSLCLFLISGNIKKNSAIGVQSANLRRKKDSTSLLLLLPNWYTDILEKTTPAIRITGCRLLVYSWLRMSGKKSLR
ncbi:hypothetical protein Pfo_010065 [Paulownia fortunei]|nr:hypothetical protein Pfo_010065 [Paulownia fortunei]